MPATNQTQGAGFSELTPKPSTRNVIVTTDPVFAGQVIGNNRACARAPACAKAPKKK